MNARAFILVSLAFNLALGVVVYRCFVSPVAPVVIRREVRLPMVTATNTSAVEVSIAPVSENFDWSRLASADFKRYRDNLRAVGCPEPTVRDIITAEIDDQFLRKRHTLMDDFQKRFWEMVAHDRQTLERGDWKKPLEALNKEREQLLADVLGKDVEEQGMTEEWWTKRNERRYAWLAETSRAKMVVLEMESYRKKHALMAEISARADPTWTDADRAREEAINQELMAARKQSLTPEELAEYDLRNSNGAHWAANLPGFEATEDEWRAVAKLQQQYDKAREQQIDPVTGLPFANELEGQAAADLQAKLKAELDDSIKSTLGAERFAQYDQANDSNYQQARRITQRYGLPDSVAAQASELQKSAEAAAKRLRDDAGLSSQARQEAIAAVQEETRRSLKTTLGEKVFSTYQKYDGDWLDRLETRTDEQE